MNVKPYLGLAYTFDGTGVDVAVGVDVTVGMDGSNVAEGTTGTGVKVSVDSGAEGGSGVAVAVDVGRGGTVPLLRTMLGATQTGRSPVGEPFALVLKMNLTFLPARVLRSTSA